MITLSIDDRRIPADHRSAGLYLVIRPTAEPPRGSQVPAAFGVVSTHATQTAAEIALDKGRKGARKQGGYSQDMIAVIAAD